MHVKMLAIFYKTQGVTSLRRARREQRTVGEWREATWIYPTFNAAIEM